MTVTSTTPIIQELKPREQTPEGWLEAVHDLVEREPGRWIRKGYQIGSGFENNPGFDRVNRACLLGFLDLLALADWNNERANENLQQAMNALAHVSGEESTNYARLMVSAHNDRLETPAELLDWVERALKLIEWLDWEEQRMMDSSH